MSTTICLPISTLQSPDELQVNPSFYRRIRGEGCLPYLLVQQAIAEHRKSDAENLRD